MLLSKVGSELECHDCRHCTVVSLLPDSLWATETHLLEKGPAQSHVDTRQSVLLILEARDQSLSPSYLAI